MRTDTGSPGVQGVMDTTAAAAGVVGKASGLGASREDGGSVAGAGITAEERGEAAQYGGEKGCSAGAFFLGERGESLKLRGSVDGSGSSAAAAGSSGGGGGRQPLAPGLFLPCVVLSPGAN